MKDIKIRIARNKREIQQVFKIREIVFIKGQGVSKSIERDKYDKSATHVIAFYKGRPVGCARIVFFDKTVKVGRIAVLKQYRGKGFGIAITKFITNYCKRKRVKEIILHSQYYIKDLYKKLGFRIRGKPFMEAKMKHVEMYLRLSYNK